jgi:hypothetical protein
MDFPRLGKLSLPNVAEPEDVVQCGSLEYYDKAYDRLLTDFKFASRHIIVIWKRVLFY